jgi:FtsP/CotA-like multicopper oxidase with cupredoxin domain
MPNGTRPLLCRRALLRDAGISAAALATAPIWMRAAVAERISTPVNDPLEAAPGTAALLGPGQPHTAALAYNKTVPGPALNMHQGKPFRSVVHNGLTEGTTVHWHGIRLPNAMDGVPFLTQKPIAPGSTFTYAFIPPDAGTFWYHPHEHTAGEMGRGLAGALIVEEPEPPAFDRDLLWVLQDWELEPGGALLPGFDTFMQAAMAGRIGNVVTINGEWRSSVPMRAGERVRLRLVNACLARFMALRFTGHRVVVIALDGQPVTQPFVPAGGRVLIAPAQRVDLALDTTGEPGSRHPVIDDFYSGRLSYQLTDLAYTTKPRLHRKLPSALPVLQPNPVPKPDLRNPVRHHLTIVGGMMGGMNGGMTGAGMGMMADGKPVSRPAIWGIRSRHGANDGMAPIFTIPLGRTALITLENRTRWWHPMHLHGYSFTVLSRNGVPMRHPHLHDTVVLRPNDTVDFAFAADNPGKWMFHCHVIEHQETGLMTVIEIA